MTEKLTPYPAQRINVDLFLTEPTKAGLLADDMGVGKTMQAVTIIVEGGFKRVLIEGIKDTYDQFAERLAAQSDGEIVLRRLDSSKPGKLALRDFLAGSDGIFFAGAQFLVAQDFEHRVETLDGKPVWSIDRKTGLVVTKPGAGIGPALLPVPKKIRIHLKTFAKIKRPLDLLIFDEVHLVANRKAIGRTTLRTLKSEWKLGMSGTFMGNKFENAWSITRWLWPELIDSQFLRWKRQWCTVKDVYAQGGKAKEIVTGERIPGEYVKTLPLYMRAEAAEQPPAAKIVYVDLSVKQRQQYEDLERDLLVYIPTQYRGHLSEMSEHGFEALVASLPISLRTRLRQATLGEMSYNDRGEVDFAADCDSSKLGALRGVLDHYGAQPVAIYTSSKRFAKVAVARMRAAGYNAVEWSGDVSSKQRTEIKRQFLAGEIQYIVAVIQAFSTGLDGFQRVCNKVVWMDELEGNGAVNAQALARFFRPGRVGEFETVKILARDTFDTGIFSKGIMAATVMGTTLRIAA